MEFLPAVVVAEIIQDQVDVVDQGGGGQGGQCATSTGTAGTANTGGGGGGGSYNMPATTAASGGSGIVIVKELDKASGVWSLADQLDALEDGLWPKRTVNVDYTVVAGGGGGGAARGGGGGAGGYRASGYGPSPLQGCVQELGLGSYSITVGGGGSGGVGGPSGSLATSGSNSVFSSITSAGGVKVDNIPFLLVVILKMELMVGLVVEVV